MEPRFSLVQSPHLQFMSESPKLASCQEILEFWCGCWHAARYLVASDAGEHDAVSLRSHARRELAARFVGTAAGTWGGRKVLIVKLEFERLLLANIDVEAGATALFFDF